MRSLFDRGNTGDQGTCTCGLTVDGGTAILTAAGCDGDIATAPDCRARVLRGLDRSTDQIVVRRAGLEYHYRESTLRALTTAALFAERIRSIDAAVARAAIRYPLETAAAVETRADTVARVARDVGFDAIPDPAWSPLRGLTISTALIDPRPPEGATLRSTDHLETDSVVRVFETSGRPCYALEPVSHRLSAEERRRLRDARDDIATGAASDPVEALAGAPGLVPILEKYTTGYGILEDCFADPAVSDVFVTAPVAKNPVRIVRAGEAMTTTIVLRERAVTALASRLRRESGRSFSRAAPTIDATVTLSSGRRLRVAGVAEPVSPGLSFALREQRGDAFTLPGLVANDTMSGAVAALLSLAVERDVSALVVGTRGAGKTTLLGALLFELPAAVRTVVIEDTRELPIPQLQALDRDVQGLRTGTGDGPEIEAAGALRTALRLGEGALVVGEIRGEEAQVLYEAMRVGANSSAVLGTIHGDGAADVHERVTSDLGVPPSSFAATDLIVTVARARGRRRVARVEEVFMRDGSMAFEPLYALEGDGVAASTGRIGRGESHLVAGLARPGETYAEVRSGLAQRRRDLDRMARDGLVHPAERCHQ